jgi:hypothetical protein
MNTWTIHCCLDIMCWLQLTFQFCKTEPGQQWKTCLMLLSQWIRIQRFRRLIHQSWLDLGAKDIVEKSSGIQLIHVSVVIAQETRTTISRLRILWMQLLCHTHQQTQNYHQSKTLQIPSDKFFFKFDPSLKISIVITVLMFLPCLWLYVLTKISSCNSAHQLLLHN